MRNVSSHMYRWAPACTRVPLPPHSTSVNEVNGKHELTDKGVFVCVFGRELMKMHPSLHDLERSFWSTVHDLKERFWP